MTMIVLLHAMTHGWLLRLYPGVAWLAPWVSGGVNLFILVSGWFLIRVKWASVVRLLAITSGFIAVNMAVDAGMQCAFEPFSGLGSLADAVASSARRVGYWFVKYYLILVAVSPVVNRLVAKARLGLLRVAVVVMTGMEMWMFWEVEGSGFGLYHFLYLYVLGYYLSREEALKRLPVRTLVAIAVAGSVAGSAFVEVSVAGMAPGTADPATGLTMAQLVHLLAYNNPLLIVSMAAVVLAFARLKFRSARVNAVAAASFGVYLLQDGLIGYMVIYPLYRDAILSSLPLYVGVVAVSAVVLWLCSMALTAAIDSALRSFSRFSTR